MPRNREEADLFFCSVTPLQNVRNENSVVVSDSRAGPGEGMMKVLTDEVIVQGLRTRISRLGALGKLGLPLLYSRAGQESNAFCSIDRQDHTTSSGTSAP